MTNAATVKLKAGEAVRLATLLSNLARPRTPQEADEVAAWIKRLSGTRQ